jgi:predicted GIY-YIG superfamily endonuclease
MGLPCSGDVTHSRRPVRIAYSEDFPTISGARRREADVKQWSKSEKEQLIEGVQ